MPRHLAIDSEPHRLRGPVFHWAATSSSPRPCIRLIYRAGRISPSNPRSCAAGGSAILSPLGEYVAGPLFDKEGILVADLEMAEITRARFDFDVIGHYARPDVFELKVDERPRPPYRGTAG